MPNTKHNPIYGLRTGANPSDVTVYKAVFNPKTGRYEPGELIGHELPNGEPLPTEDLKPFGNRYIPNGKVAK